MNEANGLIPPQYFFDINYILSTTNGPQKFPKIRVVKVLRPISSLYKKKYWSRIDRLVYAFIVLEDCCESFQSCPPYYGFVQLERKDVRIYNSNCMVCTVLRVQKGPLLYCNLSNFNIIPINTFPFDLNPRRSSNSANKGTHICEFFIR